MTLRNRSELGDLERRRVQVVYPARLPPSASGDLLQLEMGAFLAVQNAHHLLHARTPVSQKNQETRFDEITYVHIHRELELDSSTSVGGERCGERCGVGAWDGGGDGVTEVVAGVADDAVHDEQP